MPMTRLCDLGLFDAETGKIPVIAGPCSAESERQCMETAKALSSLGIRTMRAGLWKPRTKPGSFEGVGETGLPWLAAVRRETGMAVMVETATPSHVEASLKAGMDALWIGARTVTNPFAMQELADALKGVDIPVFVKNPVTPDLKLWIGALERLSNAGVKRLGAIHRGFSIYDCGMYRNHPQWVIPMELRREMPDLPLLCDPSHIGGRRDLVEPISRQAMDLGFDGLFVEVHVRPDDARSDSRQQITPADLGAMLKVLTPRTSSTEESHLLQLRAELDAIDDHLLDTLARRMEVSRRIGEYKRDNNVSVLQAERYGGIMARLVDMGVRAGMSERFMRSVVSAIHEESVNQQLDIINRDKQ